MFSGRWINDQGSSMILREQDGAVTGVYITRIGHDDVVEKQHPLVGQATGRVIGFVVRWPMAGSVTSWSGCLVTDATGAPAIHTVWHLARERVPGDPPRQAQPWESFLTYTSVFRKAPDQAA
jgi:hypothetical protein